MAIQFSVVPRTILLCDYSKGGFVPPEMVKRRPAIVLSPRLPHRDNLHAVVPMSGTPPEQDVPYVVQIELANALPEPFAETTWWVKCTRPPLRGFGPASSPASDSLDISKCNVHVICDRSRR